jgi:hypothetical protein
MRAVRLLTLGAHADAGQDFRDHTGGGSAVSPVEPPAPKRLTAAPAADAES